MNILVILACVCFCIFLASLLLSMGCETIEQMNNFEIAGIISLVIGATCILFV